MGERGWIEGDVKKEGNVGENEEEREERQTRPELIFLRDQKLRGTKAVITEAKRDVLQKGKL